MERVKVHPRFSTAALRGRVLPRTLRRWSKSGALPALFLGLLLPLGSFAGDSSDVLKVWSFDRGIANQWGGRYNVYERDPSWARTYLDPVVGRSAGVHSLRVTVHREHDGFCGVWMKFYADSESSKLMLDAGDYRYLSFWIKGEKGGEDFDLELDDDAHEEKEDPSLTRPLRAFLPQGVSTEWENVLIPLASFEKINPRRLTTFLFKFNQPGTYRFYIDDISLMRAPQAAKASTAVGSRTRAPDDPFTEARGRMWVWNTRELLAAPRFGAANEKLLEFCAVNRIREIYLSLDFVQPPSDDVVRPELRMPERLRALLEQFHRAGLQVDALAGTPEWADRQEHPVALAVVEAVVEFNRASSREARFDGIHFDVEPYTLIEFSDPEYRSQLLAGFLEMVSNCALKLRESGLRFGCDVPAWFYPVDATARRDLAVNFRGVTKTVGEHLTDLLDTVTIMDYRNEADGANGIIAFGAAALEYASARGKRIVVGLETSIEPDSTVHFICGLPLKEFHRRLSRTAVRYQRFYKGFRLSAIFYEDHVHIGLTPPEELDTAKRAAFDQALLETARQWGATSDFARLFKRGLMEEARQAIHEDREWVGFEPFDLVDPETHQKFEGFRTVYRIPAKITFHGLGREAFTEETRSAIEWLQGYPAFAGLAFHHYTSLRTLMGYP